MSRINLLNPESTQGKAHDLLNTVQSKLGMTPNMMRGMANSPAVLDGYLALSGALSHGKLSAKVREQLALTVAEANGCEYCLAAHSAIGGMVGLSPDQVHDSRLGTAVDPRTDALLQFARKIVDTHGRVSDDDLQQVREAGFDDGAIAEVVAGVALDIFTNYFNLVAATDIDFPRAPALNPAAVAAV